MTYAVRDDVGVAVERSLGVAVLGLVAGEVPDDQRSVSAGRQEHVGAGGRWSAGELGENSGFGRAWRHRDILLHRGSQAGDPAILHRELAASSRRERHHQVRPVVGRQATYVALEGALEDQLFSHCSSGGRQRTVMRCNWRNSRYACEEGRREEEGEGGKSHCASASSGRIFLVEAALGPGRNWRFFFVWVEIRALALRPAWIGGGWVGAG